MTNFSFSYLKDQLKNAYDFADVMYPGNPTRYDRAKKILRIWLKEKARRERFKED